MRQRVTVIVSLALALSALVATGLIISCSSSKYVQDGYYYRSNGSAMPLEEAAPTQAEQEGFNTETYDHVVDNPFRAATAHPLSTFSVDVDTASYSNVRRFLMRNQLPPAGAVRVEEMINYFPYDYAPPTGQEPFAVHTAVTRCPWKQDHLLARIALKGKMIEMKDRPPSNLVFLLDVSGSMDNPNKLGLVKKSIRLLVEQLGENDRVSIVVYAGAGGAALEPTPGDRKEQILRAIDELQAGGSTNGAQGIELAYQFAVDNYTRGGINRVILCTDGDFNVGLTSQSELVDLIQDKARSGVFLTVLGFGMGNYKDSTLEKLADKGNGNYGYVDTEAEARKLLVEQATGTLITIAKDVKIQVEFNPAQIQAYRLIGYENRLLAAEDFNDDTKDAGEIGAGHTVTALYELVPIGVRIDLPEVDELKYQTPGQAGGNTKDLLTVKLRYKQPDGQTSRKIEVPVGPEITRFEKADSEMRFAAAVAGFGMILRRSPHKGQATLDWVSRTAQGAAGRSQLRRELLQLVSKAAQLNSEKLSRVND